MKRYLQYLMTTLLLVGLMSLSLWSLRVQPVLVDYLEPQTTLTLYFSDDQANYLWPEIRYVAKAEGTPQRALAELALGPADSRYRQRTVPQEAKVLSLRIEDGLALVDYSLELRDNHPGGSTGEVLTTYSIVHTLLEFDDIRRVQILLEGEIVESLVGHLDISTPLRANADLLYGSNHGQVQ